MGHRLTALAQRANHESVSSAILASMIANQHAATKSKPTGMSANLTGEIRIMSIPMAPVRLADISCWACFCCAWNGMRITLQSRRARIVATASAQAAASDARNTSPSNIMMPRRHSHHFLRFLWGATIVSKLAVFGHACMFQGRDVPSEASLRRFRIEFLMFLI